MRDLDLARGYYYEFLAYPLFYNENKKDFYEFIDGCKYISQSPIDDENIADFKNIINFSFENFKYEQNRVLFDLSYANIPLTASFYDEGRDDGKKRLKVIEILKSINFRINSEKFNIPEDYIGFIFRLMNSMLKMNLNTSKALFEDIINYFIDEFAKLIYSHTHSDFYKSYSNILVNFIQLERSIMGIKAPIFDRSLAQIAMDKKPHQSKMPTPKSKIMWDEFTKI